jgi:hypothetical protein
MSFLAKLGTALARGIAILTGLEPLIAPLFGSKANAAAGAVVKVANDLNAVAQVVVTAEALIQTPGSGAAKLAAAAPLVVNIIKTSEIVSGHKIANEQLFLQGCTDLTSAMAEILNALDGGTVKSTGTAITLVPIAGVHEVPPALTTPLA